MKRKIKSIKINSDEYPTVVGDLSENGTEFTDGKLEGTKKVDEPLKAAMNALMGIVREVCALDDKWQDELGIYSRVSGVIFKEGAVMMTAQLKHDYGESVKCVVVNTPLIELEHLTTAEEMLLETLKAKVETYIETLPVQGGLFTEVTA